MSTTDTSVTPTLRNTLLSKHASAFTYVRETFYEKVVKPSGYPFFEWNERIYRVDSKYYEDTGIVYQALA